jgi:predicted nucleotidyltransferase
MTTLDQLGLSPADDAAIKDARQILFSAFPVERVVLFGSKARGADDAESDIDLLVVTSRDLAWREREAVIDALYDIQLRHDVLLSPLVVSAQEWEQGLLSVLPLHREIERDGIAA